MKKFTIAALAICLAFAMAAPVMAVDANFSGAYRVRGSYVSAWDLTDKSESNAFMDMRLRLQTDLIVSDILSVTMRFDALDGTTFGQTQTAGDDIDFDRAYMTIKAPIGTFTIGRQLGGTFGTLFADSESDADRIVYAKTINGLTVKAIFEKVVEADNGILPADVGDADSDKYLLIAVQKMENLTAGAMLTYTNDKNTSDVATVRKYSLSPYAVGKFGPLSIQGEINYVWGEEDFDAAGTADIDYKQLNYNIEATYNLGPASIMAGYAFASGEDSDATDDTGAGGVGNDWEKLFILTTNEIPALYTLGGYGNLSKEGLTKTGGDDLGSKIIYGGVSFSPLENLNIGLIIGNATADELAAGETKDDYGTEYDLTLNWKIYDNLTYTAIAAFLSAGDLYNEQVPAITDANFDDTYALFHQLQLSF